MIEISDVIRPPSGSVIEMSGSALNAQSGGISRMHPPNGFGIRQNPGMQNSGMLMPRERFSRSHLRSSSFTWTVLSARRSTLPPSRWILMS